uniref:Uncharacterized protein n=1 Tax=Ciona savignyi TaxID=51511 RepID=H2Z0A9_CIOSA
MNTTSANRSDGESIIVPPSKQSTPKMNETSHSILSGVSEKDKNVLVDTISSLTSALSNLQMEMGYLREEQNRNYMNYYNQPHGTPSHIPSNGTPMAHSFAPNMHSFQTDRMMSPNNMSLPQNRVVQNQFTPQRQFAPLGQGYLPARVTTPVINRPLPGQMPFIDPYQQQSQATYYSPAISSPYVPAYQPEQPKYLPNYQPVPQQSYTPDTYKNIR